MFTVALGQGRRLHASELVAVFIACVIRAALGFATVQGTAFTDPFLPTIEISDASTTVRALRTLFGFVVVGVGAGVLSAYLAHLVHLGAAPTLQHLRNKKQ
jgi:H+/Cl- antiporter ClcA